MSPGDRVHHPTLGDGTVVAISAWGGIPGAQVNFGYMAVWVSAAELGVQIAEDDECRPSDEPLSGANASGTLRPIRKLTDEVVDARRGVLALKLGQVLEEHVLELSMGTEDAQANLERVVSRALQRRGRSVLIEGAWGSGKTHLLTMLTAIAAAEGMATSSIILDGEGVALSEPMGLMEAFLGSLRYPGEPAPCGLRDRLVRLRRSDGWRRLRRRGGTRIADALNELPPSAFDEPEVIQLLEDYFTLSLSASQANRKLATLGYRRAKLPPMKARRVDDRPDRFSELLEEWTEFVVLTGAKGLVLIIDEVDVEYASTVWAAELRRRRTTLLRALRRRIKSDLPLVVAFGSAPASGDVAEENDAVRDLTNRLGGVDLEIEAPRPDLKQVRSLARHVRALYERAYPERVAEIDRDKLRRLLDEFAKSHMETLSPVPREFVRGTLERLDVATRLPDNLAGG